MVYGIALLVNKQLIWYMSKRRVSRMEDLRHHLRDTLIHQQHLAQLLARREHHLLLERAQLEKQEGSLQILRVIAKTCQE